MYLDYWGLEEYPFENVPDPKFMYFSQEYEEALVRLLYAVQRKKGAALLTGEVGCGKTTLSRVLIQKLSEMECDIGLIINPSFEPIEFLKEIIYQFGVNPGIDSKVELWNILKARMLNNEKQNKSTVLIIDEAQLVSKETFEDIRLLLNFQLSDRFLLTLILIGQPELRHIIKEIKQLDQRIAIKYHLNPLAEQEVTEYITFRLNKAGAKRDIFTSDAIPKIFTFSEGIPRKINNVCDMSLMVGFISRARFIDSAIMRKVIDDLRDIE
ncbi:MAG: ExeA family protein [Syntrophales bacterium]